jgi:cystathionine beta-lyase/cystathionine gamma-synthase
MGAPRGCGMLPRRSHVKGDPRDYRFATRAIHAGQAPDPRTGSVAVPIYQTSTYIHDELGIHKGYEYARVQNPTREALEENLASLENGRTGHAFASGMAAISAAMTLVEAGEHVVVSRNVYGGTYRFFTHILERSGLRFSWVDATSLAEVASAIEPRTRMLFVETPTNPMLEVVDLGALAELAHRQDALLVVDNTFMSPYFQQPLDLGADLVAHSTTKFLNGHSDSVGGAVVAARAEHGEWLAFVQKSAGAILAPFDCFLVLRGIKTLAVRMERHESNTHRVVDLLTGHAKVEALYYPGLPEHPGHELHQRQARGFGALLSFDLGSYEAAKRLLDRVRVMSLGESLGGVETLISHPATMTHASVPAAHRAELGITDGLVRISVGIEDPEDLVADLGQALDAV